jgi:hypothetical protein
MVACIHFRKQPKKKLLAEKKKSFWGTNAVEFSFKPEGNQSVVTWSMAGENNFIAKALHLFMNMNKMVGGQFEQGPAQRKSVVEATPKQ